MFILLYSGDKQGQDCLQACYVICDLIKIQFFVAALFAGVLFDFFLILFFVGALFAGVLCAALSQCGRSEMSDCDEKRAEVRGGPHLMRCSRKHTKYKCIDTNTNTNTNTNTAK